MLALIVALILVYVVGLCIYRLKLHPLSKYPGPTINALTDWPNVYHSWKGDRHLQLTKFHEQYGPIVRYGPNRIALCTPSGLQAVYGPKANTEKADWYGVWEQLFGAPSTASIADHKRHSPRRRILQQGFSDQAIRDTEEVVLKNIRAFCDVLVDAPASGAAAEKPQAETTWSPLRNLSRLAGFLTFDIMGDMVFSTSFRMQTSDDNRPYMNMSLDALSGLNTVAYMPMLLKLKLDKIFFAELSAGMERYKVYCAEQSSARIARQNEMKTRDSFSSLITGKDPVTGQGFTTEDLQSDAAVLISSASHPVRTAICALIHYLLKNPFCLEILEGEIRPKFAQVEDIRSGPVLQSCHYLRACITEALRLSPAIPGISLRNVLKGGLTVDGEYFPEGTDIGVSTYALHHDEENFPQPYSFKPERWMVRSSDEEKNTKITYSTEESLQKAKDAYCAFSLGPFGCAGKNVAMHQMMVTIARMVWLFDMKQGEDPSGAENKRMSGAIARAVHGEYPLRDTFSAEGDGPWVQFRRRS